MFLKYAQQHSATVKDELISAKVELNAGQARVGATFHAHNASLQLLLLRKLNNARLRICSLLVSNLNSVLVSEGRVS